MTAGALAPLLLVLQDTIKVGVLHSLSKYMAISGDHPERYMLFLIDEQKARRAASLGKKLEAVVIDSCVRLAAVRREGLVSWTSSRAFFAVFGCWTSSSRKSNLPVFEELNSILFYPVRRGRRIREERDLHRRRAEPAGYPRRRLPDERGRRLAPSAGCSKPPTTLYPRTTSKILEQYLKDKGVAPEDIKINYTPFGFSDWQTEVAAIKEVRLRWQEDRRCLDHQRRR